MRIAAVTAGALVALAAVAIAATTDGEPAGATLPSAEREIGRAPLERVATPSGGVATAASTAGKAAKRKQEVRYFETADPITIEPATEGALELKCPKKFTALNGYFATENAGTFLDLSAPSSPRTWTIGAVNAQDTPNRAVFGVVCINKVK